MQLKHIILCFLLLLATSGFAQPASRRVDNIAALYNIIGNNFIYTDSIAKYNKDEAYILCLQMWQGKVKSITIKNWSVNKSENDLKRIFPLIKNQWTTNDKHLRYLYIPVYFVNEITIEQPDPTTENTLQKNIRNLEEKKQRNACIDNIFTIENWRRKKY
jgi:hypothetical protein